MTIETHDNYSGDVAKFWTQKKDQFTVIGDYLGRLPSLELLNPAKGMKVLDAGCGAGFVTRMLARSGAQTYGCDASSTMLKSARASERAEPFGIRYGKADITKRLPYGDDSFDAVITTGVLIHLSPEECLLFFCEARRVLKTGGRLVLSVTHYDLHLFGESLPTDADIWIRHERAGDNDLGDSCQYREYYRDMSCNLFESLVWAHPGHVLIDALTACGFDIVKEQAMFVTSEVLQKTGQKGTVGIPSHLQILAQKR